ncbi:MAG TPA: ATP-binding protein [Gemmatimonas sp.]|nr:ATP-binding protein [Gemmatimonas sp.]
MPRSLRSRFLVLVSCGAVLPLALIGLWLTSSATRSGERFLRQQMDRTLAEAERELQTRWGFRESELLRIADAEPVRHSFAAGGDSAKVAAAVSWAQRPFTESEGLESLVARDDAGMVLWQLRAGLVSPVEQVGRASGAAVASTNLGISPSSTIGLLVTVRNDDGRAIGTVLGRVRLRALLPSVVPPSVTNESVLALIARGEPQSLVNGDIPADSMARASFRMPDGQWVSMQRDMARPPITIALAAPLGDFVAPFEASARTGAVALALSALLVLALVAWFTIRLTRSLEDLAIAADAVSAGDLERQVAAPGNDETERVASAFNSMTASLRATLGELSQRQALSAVGEFAAALAHEVRNPLTSIRLDLQLAREQLAPDSRAQEIMGRTLRQLERLDRSVDGALRIARSGRMEFAPLDLQAAAHAAADTVLREYGWQGVEIDITVDDDMEAAQVRGDSAALEQLFLNLFLNAAQALHGPGHIDVSLGTRDQTIIATVADDGPGMSPEALTRAREPFFTTRAEGTGLGLAVADRIVSAHRGTLDIASVTGEGTTVRFALPRA